jgi:hypothetical protein
LHTAPRASREALLRRAYLDLIGLPPTPAEAAAFLADTAPGAWDRLIDTLLASPHYGERWGRHWLDVARYADSSGFEQDYDRPTPGAIAITSSARSTRTSRTTSSSRSSSPATRSTTGPKTR